PCVIFFDEIDSIAPKRSSGPGSDSHVTERMVSQLLTEIDGLEDLKGVVIIGATNRPDIIDEALLRPGRFDRILEVPLPDRQARSQILSIHTKRKPLDSSVTTEFNRLVDLTEGYTGADIEALVNAAAIAAIKEHITMNKSPADTNREQAQSINSTTLTGTTATATATAASAATTTINNPNNKGETKIDINAEKPNHVRITMKHFEGALKKIKKNRETSPSIVSGKDGIPV
ncbi:MAG: AAA family ATPase, partial [Thermoproteota archaeon]|nr:AAA family ATPase [Thermoproteota archaeon]